MPDPFVPDQPERPDPAVLLIDAVINRQEDLAARLAQQWVHRRGWSDLDTFLDTALLRTCGDEGASWLRQQLQSSPAEPRSTEPRPSIGSLFQQVFAEALAPISAEPTTTEKPQSDPWQLAPAPPAAALRALPAPRPTDLAALRAWLHSDAA